MKALLPTTGDPTLLYALAEIDENIIRKELTALEYSEQLERRKAIYLKLHPETAAGVSQALGLNHTVWMGL